jgi:alkylation response protein AidB-like acyl-CoA dehydrogenase
VSGIVGMSALSEDERRAFIEEATAFLESNAERRPAASGTFAWGKGSDDLRLMGGKDEEGDEDARLAAARAWRAKAFDAGFAWVSGPKEYGGGGRHPDLEHVYRSLEADFDVPDQGAWQVAWEMVGPAILVHGSEDVKQRYLRPIYRGEILCSQLLSEPEAGSDLAGLKTRAVRDGDEWIVNGQKVWNSYAHKADLGQLMARTDPDVPKHQGLTMFLLPMNTPGVEPRPLRQMNGNAEFNEVFLTDVRVPDANRVGEAGSGWRAVLTTLMSERASVGSGKSATVDPVTLLMEMARWAERAHEPVLRQRLAEVLINKRIIEWNTARAEAEVAAGRERGPEGSIVKLLGSRQNRRIADVAGEILGALMVADTGAWGTYTWSNYLCSTPGLRIAGGTDEIQHNILGERVLGLPKEPGRG